MILDSTRFMFRIAAGKYLGDVEMIHQNLQPKLRAGYFLYVLHACA